MGNQKHWAIIGAGNGGQAFAAYLSMQGLKITVYDAFQSTVDALNEKGGVTIDGGSRYTGFGEIAFASTNMEQVLEGAEVIFVILPSPYHDEIAAKMAPYLKDGQTIIINPIAPLGTMSFKKILDENGCTASIMLAGSCTLLFACRMQELGKVHVNGQKNTVTISAYPSCDNEKVEAITKPYIPEFKYVPDILAVSFDNLNFEFHPGPTLLYTAMIEKEIDFEYYIDFVPSQTKLIEAVDKERMAICMAYEVDAMDATETFRSMYGYPGKLYDMVTNADCYKGIKGPKNMKVRYLMEDVPFALKAVQVLAKIANINTPAIDSIVNLAYILLDDVLEEGRTIETLGLTANSTVADVLQKCRG